VESIQADETIISFYFFVFGKTMTCDAKVKWKPFTLAAPFTFFCFDVIQVFTFPERFNPPRHVVVTVCARPTRGRATIFFWFWFWFFADLRVRINETDYYG
jgi:hypothetical protein